MRKSKKFILVVVLAAVVLVGSIGGVALANTENGDDSQPETLLDRVADILQDEGISITSEQIEDAFAQARSEMRDEVLDSYLQKLVDEERITQEQASEYRAWLEAKPDMPLPGPFRCFEFHGSRGGMKWSGGHHFGDGTCPRQ